MIIHCGKCGHEMKETFTELYHDDTHSHGNEPNILNATLEEYKCTGCPNSIVIER